MEIQQDWNRDGYLIIKGAKTLDRYHELTKEGPDTKGMGIFFAFSNDQLKEGIKSLQERGLLKPGEKLLQGFGGSFGTREAFAKWDKWYEERNKLIAAECDPQEVYLYEYNNFESCISWDGDLEAIKTIISIFGVDAARKINRYRAFDTIDDIIKPKSK